MTQILCLRNKKVDISQFVFKEQKSNLKILNALV